MIALVSPAAFAIGRNAAFSVWRFGSPKLMFDAPRHMFRPSSSRIARIVSIVVVTAWGSAPTVIASGSITMSSSAIPYSSTATRAIFRVISRRSSTVIGMPVSSFASAITAAPWRLTSGRIASRRSSSPVTELTRALPS